jgi:hypothetical protein
MANIDFSYFGYSGSTVRANGLSGYLRFFAGSTTKIATGIKALDIGSSGFTMNNQFSSGSACSYEFDTALTGAGTITFGTKHQNDNDAKSFYTFNGDVSEFTGIVQFGSQSYRPIVVFKASGDVVPEPTDWGQIMITSNKSVNVCKAWNSVGGYWIRGTANVSSTGSLVCGTGTQKIAGDGVIRYAAIPTSDSSPELSSSGWTGTVELSARSGSGEVPLAKLGHSGSKIVINGITGLDANSIYLSGGTEINAVVELKGLLKLTNGSTGNNYTFAEVTGSGNMSLSATGSPNTPTLPIHSQN